MALLDMMARRDDTFHEHLENGSRNSQYTLKTVQNEVIDVIAEYLRLRLTTCLDADDAIFAIMADEVTDPHANQETLSACLRILDDNKVKEVFFLLCLSGKSYRPHHCKWHYYMSPTP